MGLPIWGESIAEKPKTTIKSDPTAAARSPIRRFDPSQLPSRRLGSTLRSSTTYGESGSHRLGLVSALRRSSPRIPEEHSLRSSTHTPQFQFSLTNPPEPIEPSIRPSHPPPVPDTPWSSSHRFPESSLRNDGDVPRISLRDGGYGWHQSSRGPSMSLRPLPYAPRRSREYRSQEDGPARSGSSWVPDGPLDLPRVRVMSSPRPMSRDGSNPRSFRASALPTPPADVNDVEFPPLQRMSRQVPPFQEVDARINRLNHSIDREQRRLELLHREHIRHMRHYRDYQTINGLGDRDRSPTPSDDEAWDTMVSTITPDPVVPSAGSSFASAAASASFDTSATNSQSRDINSVAGTTSNSNGSNSVHTSITVPDVESADECQDDAGGRAYIDAASDTSDSDSDLDSTAELINNGAVTVYNDFTYGVNPYVHPPSRNEIASAPTPPPFSSMPRNRSSSTQPLHLRSPSPGGSRRSPLSRPSNSPTDAEIPSVSHDHAEIGSDPAIHSGSNITHDDRPSDLQHDFNVLRRHADALQMRYNSRTRSARERGARRPSEEMFQMSREIAQRRRELEDIRSSIEQAEWLAGQAEGGRHDFDVRQLVQESDRLMERIARRHGVADDGWWSVGLDGMGESSRL
ncbi:MAG: hypothetical protein M1820_004832 [Bogoriella megaspora]|nr:MAG: hypothetical protein M1820_004832 [Bogoriella megaspora]